MNLYIGTAMEQKWNFIKIHELCKDDTKVIEFIKTRELIKKFVKCEKYQSVMEMKYLAKGWFWRCQKKRLVNCRKVKYDFTISIKAKSWYSKSKLPIGKILQLTYILLHIYQQFDIVNELELNKTSVSHWMALVREVSENWTMKSSEQIEGEREVVEIDESNF